MTRTAQERLRHNVMRQFRYNTDPAYRARVLHQAEARRAAFLATREARLDQIIQSYLDYVRSVPA